MAARAAQVATKSTGGMFSRWGRRDPELYVLAGMVTTVFVGVGYYIGSKDKISEQNVILAKDGKAMPWQQEGHEGDLFKYKYHPKGNPKNPPRHAPGALHETTVWVKMSQEVYDRFDKKGEGYQ